MSNSKFCIQQRHKEQQRLKKLLMFGFASSTVLHGILAYILPRFSFESLQVEKEPIEMIIVDKPKPKPEPKPTPKVQSKPIVEHNPTPVKLPEPTQEQTPPSPEKTPEAIEKLTPPPPIKPPEPTAKKVLTAPTPTPTPTPTKPEVSAPVKTPTQPSPSKNEIPPQNTDTPAESIADVAEPVATNSESPAPEASIPEEGISCVSNCEPEYPDDLEGIEGSAGVKLTIDRDGNVIGAELATADSNSKINRQALLAARQMQFSSPGDSVASVQVRINFTVEGSQYDRARREEQERSEQAKKEREEETARQEQLKAEERARKEQQEQVRQQQLEQQQQESTPPPLPEAEPVPKSLPALSPEELDKERLRKFKERMDNYQKE